MSGCADVSAHRFFLAAPLPLPDADGIVTLPLAGEDLRHAVSVARIRPGETIVVVEPAMRAVSARVADATRNGVTVTDLGELPYVRLPDVTLMFGVPKGSKADLVVEKATELGASRLVPALTARTAHDAGDKASGRCERWRRIARAAAAQSQRVSVPFVEEPMSFPDIVADVPRFDAFLVAWEEAAASGIGPALAGSAPDARVAVLVGPEGGLTAQEVAALTEAGAVSVSMGATILRAETAAVVAVALASAALGGMGA